MSLYELHFQVIWIIMLNWLHVVALLSIVQCLQAQNKCDQHCEYDYSVRRNTILKQEQKLAGYQQDYNDVSTRIRSQN